MFFQLQMLHCSDGGYFNAIMSFPSNYPISPPTVKFTSELWHPNGWYLQFSNRRQCFLFFSNSSPVKIENSLVNWFHLLHEFQCIQMGEFVYQFFILLVMIQMDMSLQVSVGLLSIRYYLSKICIMMSSSNLVHFLENNKHNFCV